MAEAEDTEGTVAPPPNRRPRGYWSAGRSLINDAPPPDVRIYVVRCGEFVKVGIAANMTKRLRGFACDNPYEVQLVCTRTVRADAAHIVEARAHAQLGQFHHRGEWFRCPPDTARRAVNSAVGWLLGKMLPWDEARLEQRRIWANLREIEAHHEKEQEKSTACGATDQP